ncbi:hypothetical protein OT109_05545 [Phycisphaeraceae bacterium D3-23]
MYKLLLISKYLRRKLAPLFAAVSVSFCTAMVIIVVSVMGGFLDLMRTTAKTLSGDVMVQSNLTPGFPHYDELARRIETLDGVELATPVVETFALMRIGNRDQVVQVVGIVPGEMSRIINYNESLLWTGEDLVGSRFSDLDEDTRAMLAQQFDLAGAGQRLEQPALLQLLLSDIAANRLRVALIEDDALRARFAPTLGPLLVGEDAIALPDHALVEWLSDPLAEPYVLSKVRGALLLEPGLLEAPGFPAVAPAPAIVIGVAVNPYHRRDKRGQYSFDDPETGYPTSFAAETVSLTLVPFSPGGELAFEPVRREIAVANEFKSGFYQTDQNVVYAPLGWLQEQLQMQRSEDTTDYDPFTGQGGETVVTPARAHNIIVKAKGEQDADQLARDVQQVVNDFYKDHTDVPVTLTAITWEQKHGALLGAVQNEKGLVTFLFAIISIVAIVMVATTFYMIVLEKTRDIGVLRAIGAPATGVLGLFLTYGLVIGVIGTGLGVWIGWAVVTNLNNIQEALANRMATLIGVVLIAAVVALGVTIVTAWQRRHREFGIGTGILLFFAVAAGLLTVVYYTFPSITLPIASGIDPTIGWRMWDPQTYYFERIPDRINWGEVLWIAVGAVVSCVIGAAIPAIIAALLNPIEALRYE